MRSLILRLLVRTFSETYGVKKCITSEIKKLNNVKKVGILKSVFVNFAKGLDQCHPANIGHFEKLKQ